eukprot:499605-Rhodomonas_salina.3
MHRREVCRVLRSAVRVPGRQAGGSRVSGRSAGSAVQGGDERERDDARASAEAARAHHRSVSADRDGMCC